jgi:hypothetical protein
MTWLSIAALIVVGFLAWNLHRRFAFDRIDQMNERRKTSARVVSHGEYIDGNRHLEVALAVTPSTFYYENADMQASIDLQSVREIEYDTELATGTAIHHGKVLRLRAGSQAFEFVIPEEMVERWQTMLPANFGTEPSVQSRIAIGNGAS